MINHMKSKTSSVNICIIYQYGVHVLCGKALALLTNHIKAINCHNFFFKQKYYYK